MPLRQEISDIWGAVQDRIELSGGEQTWQVTGGSFDSALSYARARFGEPAVLARKDRNRWWPRVTLTVTTDPRLASSAPPVDRFAGPVRPRLKAAHAPRRPVPPLPPSLEEIFEHQEELRLAEQYIPQQRSRPWPPRWHPPGGIRVPHRQDVAARHRSERGKQHA